MLGDLDLKRIRDGLAGRDLELALVHHASCEEKSFSDTLLAIAEQIAEQSGGRVSIRSGDGEGIPALPALSLSVDGSSNIHYLAEPKGPELPPFLEALKDMTDGCRVKSYDWADKLASIEKPAELYVFMAEGCPHCPQVVRSVLRVASVCRQVAAYVIDAGRYERLAGDFSVRSVPFVVLDRELSTIGPVSVEEIAEQICDRQSSKYPTRVFESLLETGRVSEVASRISRGKNLKEFSTVWVRSNTSSRLGLMMAAELGLNITPGCLADAVPELLAALSSGDAALRGDTADLLGQIGDRRAEEPLRGLLSDPNPDVVELARDALETLTCG